MRRRADPWPRVVLGLDLSLTGTGMVAIREAWATPGPRMHDWSLVAHDHAGYRLDRTASTVDAVRRNVAIARRVVDFASASGATHAFVEEYAFNQSGAMSRAIAELGGVVKRALVVEYGFDAVATVVASSARKLAFGVIPRGTDYKRLIADRMARVGAPFDTGDERDAFVVANYGLTELGLPAMVVPA